MNRIIPGWYSFKGFTIRFCGFRGAVDAKNKWEVFSGLRHIASFSNLRTAQAYIRMKIKNPDLNKAGK